MRYILRLSLFSVLFILVHACSQDGPPQANIPSVDPQSVQIGSLDVVISQETDLLGEPREIVYMDEQHFAIYDHAFNKIMVFDTSGSKQYDFGSVGRGPGEWDPMSGAADLNFRNDQFLTTNREEFRLDLFSREGEHIKTIPYSHYPRYSQKVWIADNELLVSTLGKENALAVVTSLDDEEDIRQRIGKPATNYSQRVDLDQERQAYANGEIPESAQNEALAAKTEDGFILFINALGEIRKYSDQGELLFKKLIPNTVRDPIFDHIVQRNTELDSPGVVAPLQYAKDVQVKNGLLYIFIPKQGLDPNLPDSQLLIYDLQGELKKQLVFTDPQREHFLYDMMIDHKNTIYLIDIMNAQVLRYKAELN